MSLSASRVHSFVVPVALTAAALGLMPAGVRADPQGTQLLFKQQVTVQSFDLVSGAGSETGTVTGLVSGTSSTAFQLIPSGPPTGDSLPISFQDHVIVTDLDGDQIVFNGAGTGTFHLGVPGFPFSGSGGPLVGNYVVASGTGKYSGWAGNTFAYKGVMTNPPTPPGGLGTVYGEITFRGRSGLN